ncbi:MAG TPA: hypothetical protein GYA07_07135 [Verrucomicrobia bacterium]|nr:hypothetical protein [Verrucomicrobiota bacterium]HOP97282.1 hypothetical protein [Verrucomicrobiota bacterium]HPU57808.1 hypothetical protein [Verrucomicrobiota bacterium]
MKLNTLLVLLALTASGCITHRSTVYRDSERRKVEFESDAAARLFYETLSSGGFDKGAAESATNVGIPFVFSHERKVVTGPNTRFNRAVEVCDANRDGVISEQEARIFANQH